MSAVTQVAAVTAAARLAPRPRRAGGERTASRRGCACGRGNSRRSRGEAGRTGSSSADADDSGKPAAHATRYDQARARQGIAAVAARLACDAVSRDARRGAFEKMNKRPVATRRKRRVTASALEPGSKTAIEAAKVAGSKQERLFNRVSSKDAHLANEIAARLAHLQRLFNSGEIDSLSAELFTTTGVFVPAGQAAQAMAAGDEAKAEDFFVGHRAIAKGMEAVRESVAPMVAAEPRRVHFIGPEPKFAFELGTFVFEDVDGRHKLRRCAQWTKGGADDQGGDGRWRMCFCMLYDEAAIWDSDSDGELWSSSSGYSSDVDLEREPWYYDRVVTSSDEDSESEPDSAEYPSFDSGSDFDPVVTWEYSQGRAGSPPSGSFTDSGSAGYSVQGSDWHTWRRPGDAPRQSSPTPPPSPPDPLAPQSPFGPADEASKWRESL